MTKTKQILIRREELAAKGEQELREWLEVNKKRNPAPPELEKEYSMQEAGERLKQIVKKQNLKK